MKLVHVTSCLGRMSAGVREVIINLARQQREQGIEVTVLGLGHPGWSNDLEDWGGITTETAPILGPRAFAYAPKMLEKLLKLSPNIVHLHGMWLHHGRSVLQWHTITGKPFVISPHGMLSDVALSYSSNKKRVVSWWFQKNVMENASLIHVTCESERLDVHRYCSNRSICIVPNGIEDVARSSRVSSREKTVLSLGRIHKKKALDQLVLAWAALEKEFPEWSLLIVGPDEGGEVHKLNSIIRDFGLERVTIQKPVYGDDKVKLMSSADIFALPTYSENFAITVAESLILGVPVISSHGAPWAGLETEGCGRWVPIGYRSMEKSLREMMAMDDIERKALGARGRDWMLRDFSWSSISHRLLRCYEHVLEVE